MSTAESSATQRYHGFDYLRVAGILAVVYIHGCDTNLDARRGMKWLGFAVPCFFMISAFLAQDSLLRTRVSYSEWVQRKFMRLAPAFLAWSAIYGIIRLLKSWATGVEMDSTLLGIVFWGDASYQLYFVPMLFYSFVIWTGLMIFARRHRVLTVVILTLAILACVWFERPLESSLPSNRWFIAKNLVWFPLGMLFALMVRQMGVWRLRLFWPCLIGLIAMVAMDDVNVYVLSVLVMTLGISSAAQPPDWIQRLSFFSLGVYLVHVLYIESMQAFAARLSFDQFSLPGTLAITVSSAVLAYLTCWLLGHFKATRWSVT